MKNTASSFRRINMQEQGLYSIFLIISCYVNSGFLNSNSLAKYNVENNTVIEYHILRSTCKNDECFMHSKFNKSTHLYLDVQHEMQRGNYSIEKIPLIRTNTRYNRSRTIVAEKKRGSNAQLA